MHAQLTLARARLVRWILATAAAFVSLGVLGTAVAAAAYPNVSKFIPANSLGVIPMNRPNGADVIDSIEIHDTEGGYAGTVFAFTNPQSASSSATSSQAK